MKERCACFVAAVCVVMMGLPIRAEPTWLKNLEICVSTVYESKCYSLFVRDGESEQISRCPVTGQETVLDAIAGVAGLPAKCMKSKIWVARPTPGKTAQYKILPVNWQRLVKFGDSSTNYQLFPGDRIYIEPQPQPCPRCVTPMGYTILQSGATTSARPPQ